MAADSQHSELARSFGYFEGSSTVALLRNLLVADRIDTKTGERADTSNIFETIRHDIERMPGRQILDFLVQYFVSELNWMKQLVHPPRFLIYYQGWWARNKELSVEDAEFAVLTLRICSYAAQFLPSPSHPGDEISGISLSEIRATCGEIGDSLLKSCLALDWEGSIFRVQHILFAALNSSCEGRTDRFWEGIASACRAAQKAGLHIDESCHRGNGNSNEFEKEMRRRTLCNLYLLDSHLSRQLDRVPFLPDDLVTDMLPRLRLKPDLVDLSIDQTAPELFTERLMQVQLGRFWRKVSSKRSSPYDPCVGEQCYEQLLSEYLPTIPPALSLNPDTQWDTQLPKLPMQRQLLYISIFDSICWNFKPLLLLTQPQIATLPPYKRVLIQSQKQRLASAALKELDAISALHSMFGGSRTRFAAIIFNSFEASVLLLTLGLQPDFPFDQEGEYHDDILKLKPTRCKVMQAVEKVLARLHMLAEVNEMAAAGARVASQLFARAMSMSASMTSAGNADLEVATTNSSNFVTNTSLPWPEPFSDALLLEGDTGQWATDDQSASGLMRDLLSTLGAGNAYPEPEPELQQWESGVNWS
ncbi:hypothetical protein BJY01DRAFT_245757 [Aspergillus pseudoustus]|uniref:Xylanolytic transcriptional activator regulatory domain-containing protein n=1 Tax=Aspergillus pseudoustus TaxID=1810923 RepID=A0ABR4KC04_9EURO